MKGRIRSDSQILHTRLGSFLSPRSLSLQCQYIEKLKMNILTCDVEERTTRKARKAEKIDSDIKMSKATLNVADLQCRVSAEHGTLLKIEDRLSQLQTVEDEFAKRSHSTVQEEKRCRDLQAFHGDKVNELEAKLATALAVEGRVHRECEVRLHKLKTDEKTATLKKTQALRDYEDALSAMNNRVRTLAARRIQAGFKTMIERTHSLVMYDDQEKNLESAAQRIQTKVRMWCTKKHVREVAKTQYEKHYDRESGYFFYVNNVTGEARWTKPKLLGDEDIGVTDIYNSKHNHKSSKGTSTDPPLRQRSRRDGQRKKKKRSRVVKTVPLTVDAAAINIQKSFRGWLVRQRVKAMVSKRFEKLFDDESGSYYYWDTVAEVSQWHKPKVLGPHDDIEVEI